MTESTTAMPAPTAAAIAQPRAVEALAWACPVSGGVGNGSAGWPVPEPGGAGTPVPGGGEGGCGNGEVVTAGSVPARGRTRPRNTLGRTVGPPAVPVSRRGSRRG